MHDPMHYTSAFHFKSLFVLCWQSIQESLIEGLAEAGVLPYC